MSIFNTSVLKIGSQEVSQAYLGEQSLLSSWVPSVLLTGSVFTAAQLEPGIPGAKNTVSNVNRIYFAASNGATTQGGSSWFGRIKATEAKINIPNGSTPVGAVVASIDGGAYTACANDSYLYTLFTGLPDVEHTVSIRMGTIWGADNIYMDKAGGNILTLQGSNTYVAMPNQADWVYPGVTHALGVASSMNLPMVANYSPARSKTGIGVTSCSNNGMAKIRGAFKRILVYHNGNDGHAWTKIYVSKNGANPTIKTISSPGTGGGVIEFDGLDGRTATYYVWTNKAEGTGVFAVVGDGPHVDCGFKGQIHQFGDSITYGSSSDVPGETEIFKIAPRLGYVGLTIGVAGQTIGQLETAMFKYLAAITASADDVAIVAIGRNGRISSSTPLSGAEIISYTTIVNLLLAKGYGRVLCRGIYPDGNGSWNWATANAQIANIAASVDNIRCSYVDVQTAPLYTSFNSDGTHPDGAGFDVLATYMEPKYRAILETPITIQSIGAIQRG
jgi:hypothetical protein